MKKIIMTSLLAMSMALAGAQPFDFNEMTYSPRATRFHLNTRADAQGVTLRIYDSGTDGKVVKKVEMKRDKGTAGQWDATVKGDQKGRFYTFDVKYDGAYRGENPGIFATAVGVNGRRGAIIDPTTTNPEGWESDVRPAIAPKDHIIYEMHHRDFSIARNVNLDPDITVKRQSTNYPGKFLALTEQWALGHLTELGINAVHVLPSFDYASIDETALDRNRYNWGYDPLNYNVPEGGYSTNPFDPATRNREFKMMVQALHKAGIRVVLDVVYNHTFSIDESNFQRTCPDVFFRKNADGTWSNGSGCGNETASERDIMRNYMIASVLYWINEYHIDGLRFDLMGVHDIETMNAIAAAVHEVDPTILIYGEGWSAGSCAYPHEKLAMKAHIKQMPEIAAFSDDMRDGLRGPFDNDSKGAFLAGIPGQEESIKFGIAGAIEHSGIDYSKVNYSKEAYALEPTQMIAYVSCHDDMCLVDRLKASIPHLSQQDLVKLDLLAQTAVFTSQGIPFMLSGEELLRDKKGVHNSYESPDSINCLNWNGRFKNPKVFNYYKNLIALRKAHEGFRLGSAQAVKEHLEFLPGGDCLVVFRLKDLKKVGDSWNNIVVIINGNTAKRPVKIPKARYTIVADGDEINADGHYTLTTDEIIVPARSAIIMHD